jgi:vancomycin resistance protein YoaR
VSAVSARTVDWRRFGVPLLAAGALLLLAAGAGAAVGAGLYLPHETAPDVVVAAVPLRGLTRAAAAERLRAVPPRAVEVEWLVDGMAVSVPVGLVLDVPDALNRTFSFGRTGRLADRLADLRQRRLRLAGSWRVAPGEAERVAEVLGPLLIREPVDAVLRHRGDQVWIDPDTPGRRLDEKALRQQVADVARGLNRFTAGGVAVPAAVTAAGLRQMGIASLRGKMTTHYETSLRPRSNNILVASRSIAEVLLEPGEFFAFNARVGPRTIARGYQVAQVILADALVPGLGGGICQLSSTLYAAAVLANLTVLERINHSLPIWYMDPGMDATVSWGGPDLVLRNETGSHVLITVSNEPVGALTVRIFGAPAPAAKLQSVVLDSYPPPVQTTVDPALAPGHLVVDQAGQPGLKAALYRVSDGERRLVNLSSYLPLPRKVRVGPAAPEEPDQAGSLQDGAQGQPGVPSGQEAEAEAETGSDQPDHHPGGAELP